MHMKYTSAIPDLVLGVLLLPEDGQPFVGQVLPRAGVLLPALGKERFADLNGDGKR